MLTIRITRTNTDFDDLSLPQYATEGAAGLDVRAAVGVGGITIVPGAVVMIPTALAVEIPLGYEAQVRSRSGLAAKNGVFCLNAPGTIDSDFRGEIHVILANFGTAPFVVQRGERVAQLVVAKFERVAWEVAEELAPTERGTGGFGSTGTT